MGTYRHTQIGWVILFGVGAAAVATLVRAGTRPTTGYVVVLLALVLVLALFSTLTVVGDEDGLDVRFGPGLVRRRFKWSDIRSDTPVRNSWLAGWGIRWIGSGWLFNVSGLDAVELSLKSGKMFRIGTTTPQACTHSSKRTSTSDRARNRTRRSFNDARPWQRSGLEEDALQVFRAGDDREGIFARAQLNV